MVKLVEKEKLEKEYQIAEDALLVVNSLGDWVISSYDIATSSDKIIFYMISDTYSKANIKEMFEDITRKLESYGSKLKSFRKVKSKTINAFKELGSDDVFYFIIFPNGEWLLTDWYNIHDTSRGVKTFEIDKDTMDFNDILKRVENEKEFVSTTHRL